MDVLTQLAHQELEAWLTQKLSPQIVVYSPCMSIPDDPYDELVASQPIHWDSHIVETHGQEAEASSSVPPLPAPIAVPVPAPPPPKKKKRRTVKPEAPPPAPRKKQKVAPTPPPPPASDDMKKKKKRSGKGSTERFKTIRDELKIRYELAIKDRHHYRPSKPEPKEPEREEDGLNIRTLRYRYIKIMIDWYQGELNILKEGGGGGSS